MQDAAGEWANKPGRSIGDRWRRVAVGENSGEIAREEWAGEHGVYLADAATMDWPEMVVGCRGPHRQGRTSSTDYVTPVTAALRGCTPDCLQPHNPPLLPGFLSLPLPPRTQEGCKVTSGPLRPPPPAPPPPPPLPCSRWRNSRLRRRSSDAQATPGRLCYAGDRPAAAITFAGKSSGPLRGRPRPGLTLQRASAINFFIFPFLFLHSLFFSFPSSPPRFLFSVTSPCEAAASAAEERSPNR